MQDDDNAGADPGEQLRPMTPPTEHPAPATIGPSLTPVGDAERIGSLDVLRGFALLGILVMNIQAFAMIGIAYMNPTAWGDLTGANYWIWYVCHLIADQKFMTIFSLLFGAGIVVMDQRARATGRGSAAVHYRRMGWLILFGLLHAHLLWYGDILYFYGMCGLGVWLLRRAPIWLQIGLGIALISVATVLSLAFAWMLSEGVIPAEVNEQLASDWQPTEEVVQTEIDAYQGNWLDQAALRTPASLAFETFMFVWFIAWRAGGLMLLGMGLFRLGVFSAKRSTGFYAAMALIGAFVGVPLVAYGAYLHEAGDWAAIRSMCVVSQFNYWASILVSLGWVGVVMLIYKSGVLSLLCNALAAVGRMALTNYFMHTIICTTIFYGHGFGLFSQVERPGQILIVFAIWVFQLIASPIWLRYFYFGPFEWLWRSLTYWKAQPIVRRL